MGWSCPDKEVTSVPGSRISLWTEPGAQNVGNSCGLEQRYEREEGQMLRQDLDEERPCNAKTRVQTLFWILLGAIWRIFHRIVILNHWDGTTGISWILPTAYLWVPGSDVWPEIYADFGFILYLGSRDWHPRPRGWAHFHDVGPRGGASLGGAFRHELHTHDVRGVGHGEWSGVEQLLSLYLLFPPEKLQITPQMPIQESLHFWR